MKIFLTGANGFIGRAFCESAAARGHEILGLCRSANVKLPHHCRFVCGTLAEIPWQEVGQFAPDAALHLAWIATPGIYLKSQENESLALQSESLFSGLVERGVRHIAGVGTCIEYASSGSPLKEDSAAIAPASPYAVAKVNACRHLQSLAEAKGTRWSWLRLFYPYGEGEHPDRLPSALMRRVAAGGVLELKTPDSIKDYIHVHDVAEAILAVLEQELVGSVNVGTGNGVRIEQLARLIARQCGGDDAQVQRAPETLIDPFPVCVADTGRLSAVNWRPRITLEEGLARLWGSLRQQG